MTHQVEEIKYNQTQYLDLYLQDQPGRPLVVNVHGGGFVSGDKRDKRCKQSAAQDFTKMIRSEGAEPVLFMTWAYADKPEMTKKQAGAFRQLGNKLKVMVIPVGLAFEQA
jgi:hypothetical protein